MTDFRFTKTVTEEHLVRSGRYCCLCEEQKGARVEVHHIVPKAKGGTRDFENAIVLCFQCHADVHAYEEKSPKGRKFSPTELRRRRDNWYEKFKQRMPGVDHKTLAGELLEQFADKLAPPQGATAIGTEELAKAAGPDTEARLQEALELQAQHKEREAIDALYEAFHRELEPRAKIELHLLLGNCFIRLSELVQAEGHYKQALEASRQAGSAAHQAAALGNLGVVSSDRGDDATARRLLEEALAIDRQLSDVDGEASDLGNLGILYYHQGDFEEAESHCLMALELHRAAGNLLGEANQLGSLANVYTAQGELAKAETLYQQALEVFRKIGNRLSEATALINLGGFYRRRRELDTAEKVYREALAIGREIDNIATQGQAHSGLGNVNIYRHQLDEAERYHQSALDLNRVIGDRRGETTALTNLATVFSTRRQYDKAQASYEAALSVSQEIGYRIGEATVLANLGILAVETNQPEKACKWLRESAALYEEIGAGGENVEKVRVALAELGCE